jgi:putative tricarboxylic transport membrane protein
VLVVACVAFFVLAGPVLGFLVVAPLSLLVLLRVLGSGWGVSVLWALGGSLVVHVVFYKLLRVPLPWGWLPPLY